VRDVDVVGAGAIRADTSATAAVVGSAAAAAAVAGHPLPVHSTANIPQPTMADKSAVAAAANAHPAQASHCLYESVSVDRQSTALALAARTHSSA
jgi:hypothetical protein